MLGNIITSMNFTLVRDAICQHLANVRDEQKQLARQQGKTEDWIKQNIDFTIFPKRFRFPDVEDLPCVYVYFNEGSFPENLQDIYENEFVGNLQVEYYAGGITETDPTQTIGQQIIATADGNAEDRLQYLTAQLYKTLCSEETNVYKATNKLVNSFKPKQWKRILTPKDVNSVESVLGAMFTFDVGINEPTYYANTVQINEFYTKLNIKEEFLNPFVRYLVEANEDNGEQ